MTIETSINGNAIFIKPIKLMGYPSRDAMPETITLAEAPIMVPLPPRHAPRDKAHHRGPIFMWPICPIS